MRLKSFRIKNYRSIKDSGICYLSGDGITILAGKNESGKTAILEALEDFDTERPIREASIHIHNEDAKPEISLTFEVDKSVLKEIANEKDISIATSKSIHLEITKQYPNDYSLSEESVISLGLTNNYSNDKLYYALSKTYSEFKKFKSFLPNGIEWVSNITPDNINSFGSEIDELYQKIEPNLNEIFKDNKNEFVSVYQDLHSILNDIDLSSEIVNVFLIELKRWIPQFILFSSFDDIFPSEILLKEAPDNNLIRDLDIISDINFDLIKSGSDFHRQTHKVKLNVRLSEDYKKFWTQDFANLHIDWDTERLLFFIKDEDTFFPPNIRSKGKQWHLAFYVRISARAKDDVANIILIDEPGLFLHATAQKDILKKLEDSAKEVPVIFSTHSPYLIEIEKLNRIRLISQDRDKGTLISNKIHKDAGNETLTPIITSIGLDLSIGLDIAKDNNILVEGISDYYYLNAFKELLNFDFGHEIHLIPCVGANKFNFIVPLMIGWGLNYCTVLDNDTQGRSVKTKLLKNFGHAGIKIIVVSDTKDDEIEDLFERDDFIEHVLEANPNEVPTNLKNSKILKQRGNKYDKVLLSKFFYEKVLNGDIQLLDTTMHNIKILLTKINEIMFPN